MQTWRAILFPARPLYPLGASCVRRLCRHGKESRVAYFTLGICPVLVSLHGHWARPRRTGPVQWENDAACKKPTQCEKGITPPPHTHTHTPLFLVSPKRLHWSISEAPLTVIRRLNSANAALNKTVACCTTLITMLCTAALQANLRHGRKLLLVWWNPG